MLAVNHDMTGQGGVLTMSTQHFHSKAALMICSARANLPQVYTKGGEIKQNRWVSVLSSSVFLLHRESDEENGQVRELASPHLVSFAHLRHVSQTPRTPSSASMPDGSRPHVLSTACPEWLEYTEGWRSWRHSMPPTHGLPSLHSIYVDCICVQQTSTI